MNAPDTDSTEYIPPKKSWWERHYRKITYIAVFLIVLAGMFKKAPLDLHVSAPTQGLYDTVAAIPEMRREAIARVEGELVDARAEQPPDEQEIQELEEHLGRLRMNTNGVLLICFDFDPGTAPELRPMAEAILHHVFRENIKVIGNVGYNVISAQLAQNIMENVASRPDAAYEPKAAGEHYIFLGYRPNAFMVYMQMGEDIITAYETDYAGNDLNTVPIMKGVRNYGEIEMIVNLTGYVGSPEMWMNVGKTKFNKHVGLGMTAVSAADYFPYIQSKQIVGLLSGLRGAAEYETAIHRPSVAVQRMRPQLYAHTLAIVLIVIGNVELLVSKFRKKRK